MRVWQVSSFGIDSLELVDRPTSQPGPGEVLVKIHAVSLNYRDLMMVKGLYNPKLKLPRIPCSDGAGQVAAVGESVTAWKSGDRVCLSFFQNWIDGAPTPGKIKGALGGDIDGTLAEYVLLKETGLVASPKHLSFDEAAIHYPAPPSPPEQRARGRQPATQLHRPHSGHRRGFDFRAPIRQAQKLARAQGISFKRRQAAAAPSFSLGLDKGLDYGENSEWDRWVVEQTSGEGVDLVVEVGGVGTLPRSLRAVKMGGMIAQIGVLTGPSEPIPIPMILHKQVRIQGIYVGSRHHFEEMNKAIDAAQLHPIFESRPWTEAREAFKEMESATHFGKLVLNVS